MTTALTCAFALLVINEHRDEYGNQCLPCCSDGNVPRAPSNHPLLGQCPLLSTEFCIPCCEPRHTTPLTGTLQSSSTPSLDKRLPTMSPSTTSPEKATPSQRTQTSPVSGEDVLTPPMPYTEIPTGPLRLKTTTPLPPRTAPPAYTNQPPNPQTSPPETGIPPSGESGSTLHRPYTAPTPRHIVTDTRAPPSPTPEQPEGIGETPEPHTTKMVTETKTPPEPPVLKTTLPWPPRSPASDHLGSTDRPPGLKTTPPWPPRTAPPAYTNEPPNPQTSPPETGIPPSGEAGSTLHHPYTAPTPRHIVTDTRALLSPTPEQPESIGETPEPHTTKMVTETKTPPEPPGLKTTPPWPPRSPASNHLGSTDRPPGLKTTPPWPPRTAPPAYTNEPLNLKVSPPKTGIPPSGEAGSTLHPSPTARTPKISWHTLRYTREPLSPTVTHSESQGYSSGLHTVTLWTASSPPYNEQPTEPGPAPPLVYPHTTSRKSEVPPRYDYSRTTPNLDGTEEITEPPSPPSDEWVYFPPTGYYYKHFLLSKTWEQAEMFCVKQGGHLVSIHDSEENAFVYNLTKNDHSQPLGSHKQYVWIGLKQFDYPESGGWKWSDGTLFDYQHWRQSKPNNKEGREHCAQLYNVRVSGVTYEDELCIIEHWNDFNCLRKSASFVCKKLE